PGGGTGPGRRRPPDGHRADAAGAARGRTVDPGGELRPGARRARTARRSERRALRRRGGSRLPRRTRRGRGSLQLRFVSAPAVAPRGRFGGRSAPTLERGRVAG